MTRLSVRVAMVLCAVLLVAGLAAAMRVGSPDGDVAAAPSGETDPGTAPSPAIADGCPAFPAFPDTRCTGVPDGHPIRPFEGSAITQDGSTFSGVRITTRIEVRANDVTLRNCEIASDGAIAIAVAAGYKGLTLERCTIRAGGIIPPAERFTVRRVKVEPSGYRADGIVVGFSSVGHVGRDVLIEDSYISGLRPDQGDHADGLQIWGFDRVSNVVIRHNYIDAANYGSSATVPNAALFLADATYENVTVEFNYLTGGGLHVLQMYSNADTNGHVVRHNRWGRGAAPAKLLRMGVADWSDNAYADNLEMIGPPVRS